MENLKLTTLHIIQQKTELKANGRTYIIVIDWHPIKAVYNITVDSKNATDFDCTRCVTTQKDHVDSNTVERILIEFLNS